MTINTELMTLDQIVFAVEKIAEKSKSDAEKAIETIASDKGDDFALNVISQMSPLKVAEIVREYDFSCPSIISWLVTPEQIVQLFQHDPLYWKQVSKNNTLDDYIRIQENALSLITSILIKEKANENIKEILEAIAENESSFFYLTLPFIGWKRREESNLLLEDSECEPGSVDHLYETIRWATPNVAEKIIDFLNSGKNALVNTIIDLQLNAEENIQGTPDADSVEDAGFMPWS